MKKASAQSRFVSRQHAKNAGIGGKLAIARHDFGLWFRHGAADLFQPVVSQYAVRSVNATNTIFSARFLDSLLRACIRPFLRLPQQTDAVEFLTIWADRSVELLSTIKISNRSAG